MISVVMATYNGSNYLRQQLLSVLDQLGPQDEVIVVDDLSSDKTIEVILSLNESRIFLQCNQENIGPCRSFAKGIDLAGGDYIFLCDQDDAWCDGKVDRVLEALVDHDLIFHNAAICDSDLRAIGQDFFTERGVSPGVLRNIFKNSYVGCCMAFKRSILNDISGGLLSAPMHDSYLGIMAEIKGKRVSFLNEQLILYRRHQGTVTQIDSRKSIAEFPSILLNRVKLLYSLALGWLIRN